MLRKPIPLGVSCGVCYFWAVSLAKIKLGFLCVRSEAPGTIPGPPLICVESLYILDENLTFMIYHYIFLCLGAAPGSSLSMAFWLPSERSRSFVAFHGSPSMAWAAEKGNSTRCFLWSFHFLGRFHCKNKAERLAQSQSPRFLST